MPTTTYSRAGVIGTAAGVLGGLSAVALLLWPPQVPPGLVSYPFTTTGFLVAQAWFFVHHLGLVILLVALARCGAVGAGRAPRVGAWVSVLGVVLLTGAELFAMGFADWDNDTANAGALGSAYGVACTLVGLGTIAAGIGVVRAGVWSGWHAWTPLLIGITQFLVLTPGMFGGFVMARLVIGLWMLTFAALGWSMYAEARRAAIGPASSADRPARARRAAGVL